MQAFLCRKLITRQWSKRYARALFQSCIGILQKGTGGDRRFCLILPNLSGDPIIIGRRVWAFFAKHAQTCTVIDILM